MHIIYLYMYSFKLCIIKTKNIVHYIVQKVYFMFYFSLRQNDGKNKIKIHTDVLYTN